MSRYIDADALKLSHCKECSLYPDKCMGIDCDWGAIIHINEMPTIDAVPVIRCKDCKYWNGAGKFCDYEMSGLEEDYCSWAEPKEADG